METNRRVQDDMNEKAVNNTQKEPPLANCSFCNRSRFEASLMVQSNVTQASICSHCAMAIVTQAMEHMVNVSAAFNSVVKSRPEWFEINKSTGAVSLIDPNTKLQNAISKVNGKGK